MAEGATFVTADQIAPSGDRSPSKDAARVASGSTGLRLH